MDKLNEIINTLVAEKSLSFEVIEQLKVVRDTNEILEKENISLTEDLQKSREREAGRVSEIEKLMLEIGAWKHREHELINREKAVAKLEHEKEIANINVENAHNQHDRRGN